MRFIIGIDLGTTNCVVSYFDTQKPTATAQLFPIEQIDKHGIKEALPMLPSFLYLDDTQTTLIGSFAEQRGAEVPTRLIHSAKSWLSNAAAQRKEKILPFEAVEEKRKMTPVEVSTSLLSYICKAWNQKIAKGDYTLEMEEQEVIITVPASFDEVARTLTAEAAQKAGLKHFTFLEEPQAAFYCWLMDHGKDNFQPHESILVCDVGGGTTDFSLIDITEKQEFRRMAVGNHLLLGGDNMDAALCYYLEQKKELDSSHHLSLLHQVRAAKESLLGQTTERVAIWISGKGSKVVGTGVSLELTYEEVEKILLDGFFGLYEKEEAIKLKRGSALRHMGLPYESDPSITKHLAHFLRQRDKKPTYLLFNGGTMKPQLFQKRIVESLNLWFPEDPPIKKLSSPSLDFSVARGAAYFGKVRRGEGVRIRGGIPRSYYLGVKTKEGESALTLLPRGTDEGTHVVSEHLFSLLPNQPVTFQLYHSHIRLDDQPNILISIDEEELTPLPPIQTMLKYGKKETTATILVQLETHLTEIGTLELWLQSQQSEHRWKLEFQLRGHQKEERFFDKRLSDETFDTSYLEPAKKQIQEAFAIGGQERLKTLMSSLEDHLNQKRNDWSPSLLRGLFETLLSQAEKRVLSPQYEARFWNLAGFLLRPGLGYPLDDFRIKQLWKLILEDSKKTLTEETQLQQWICYRRIAAGLNKGQQVQLFNALFPLVYDKKRRRLQMKGKKGGYLYAEKLRAISSFELAEVSHKVKLGHLLVERIAKAEAEPCDYWALGRLGARELFYGSVANIVSRHQAEKWVKALLKAPSHQHLPFTLALLARKTNCPEVNLPDTLLAQVSDYLKEHRELNSLVHHERDLSTQEQEQFFGDSLPLGLILS